MKKVKFLGSLLVVILFATGIGAAFGAGAGIVAMGISSLGAPTITGLRMAVTPEIWTNDIVENLWKNNEFLLKSIDESQYVLGGSVVHIPQAGAASGGQRNRKTLPATITRRGDTDVTYPLDEITTDPRFIPNIDVAELSYDKRQSCIAEDQRYIDELVAESIIYSWKPTYFIKATGSTDASNLVYGTGTRTGVTYTDFVTAKTTFNKWKLPKAGRYVMLDSEQYKQLCNDVKSHSSDNLTIVYDPVTGLLKKLEGFEIFERSTVFLASTQVGLTAVKGKSYFEYTSGSKLYTPEDYIDVEAGEKAAATTACVAGLFWSDTCVSRAIGEKKMFDNPGDATLYGDVYSFLIRCGGRSRRGDGIGVLGIMGV